MTEPEEHVPFYKRKGKELAFIIGVGGMSLFFGFGTTLTLAKKKDPKMFDKGIIGSKGVAETGGNLALRALGRATLFSVGGFGLFCAAVWKLMGVHSMEEFTSKMKSLKISSSPKVESSDKSREPEIKTLGELVDYLMNEDKRRKNDSKS